MLRKSLTLDNKYCLTTYICCLLQEMHELTLSDDYLPLFTGTVLHCLEVFVRYYRTERSPYK